MGVQFMKVNLIRLIGAMCIAAVATLPSYGQVARTQRPAPANSRNNATITVVAPSQVAVGDTFTIELQVDMSAAKYQDGASAALGGFILPIGFDSSMVKFVKADGGETPAFAKAPIFTNANTANEKGVVIAVAFNTDSAQPMSQLSVAKFTFVAEKTGAVVFTIDPEGATQHASLTSALHNNGSTPIAATYKNGAVTISNKKQTARPVVRGKSNPNN